MKRAQLVALAITIGFVALSAAPAGAQGTPTVTTDPATVEVAGEQEFVISGENWTVNPVLIITCDAPASGLAEDIDVVGCDLTNITSPIPVTNGSFEATLVYDVPAEGLALVATDSNQTESASVIVAVSGAGPDATATEAPTATEDPAASPTEAPVETPEDPELAVTGSESALLAVIGVAVVAAGAMAIGYTRRFSS